MRLVKNYQGRQIHLRYHRNPYLFILIGTPVYDTGEPVKDQGVTIFESAKDVMNHFVEGVMHINVSGNIIHKMIKKEVSNHVLEVIMAQQFSLKAGLKKFGDRGKEAVIKELAQLHDMTTYVPMDP